MKKARKLERSHWMNFFLFYVVHEEKSQRCPERRNNKYSKLDA